MKSITSKQMKKLDDLMIKNGIELVMMMENAGMNLAKLARDTLNYRSNKKIIILAGKGNNGGGGLVAARYLFKFGIKVNVILSDDEIKEVTLKQLNILKNMKVPITNFNKNKKRITKKIINNSDLIIDALLGYSAKGNPYGAVKELIILANKSKKPILSLDIPSGLNPDTGKISSPCIKSGLTLTLAMPKRGLLGKQSKKYVRRLYLADIGIPKKIYKKFGFDRKIFLKKSIVKIY